MKRLGERCLQAVGLVAAGVLVRFGWELGGYLIKRLF